MNQSPATCPRRPTPGRRRCARRPRTEVRVRTLETVDESEWNVGDDQRTWESILLCEFSAQTRPAGWDERAFYAGSSGHEKAAIASDLPRQDFPANRTCNTRLDPLGPAQDHFSRRTR